MKKIHLVKFTLLALAGGMLHLPQAFAAPLVNTGTFTDHIYTFPAGADVATLTDDGFGNLVLTEASTNFDLTTILKPTGSLTINGGGNDSLDLANAITMSADLTVSLGTITVTGPLDVSGATTPQISLSVNNLAINAALNAGTGRVEIDPRTNGRNIHFGNNSLANNLNISDAEVDFITAGVLQVGDATAGRIQFSGTGNGGRITPANVSTVHLITGSFVTDGNNNNNPTGAGGGIRVANLAVEAGGADANNYGIRLDNTNNGVESHIATFAARSSNGRIRLIDNNAVADLGLTIGSVDGIDGVINTTPASANNFRERVDIDTVVGNLVVANTSEPFDILTSRNLVLRARQNNRDIIINAGAVLGYDLGALVLRADNLRLNGTVDSPLRTVELRPDDAGDTINLGNTTDDDNNILQLSEAELDQITATLVRLRGNTTVDAYKVDISGATPGVQYDRVEVLGTVTINSGATLTIAPTFTPISGEEFVIIENDGTEAITGTFAGLPEKGLLTIMGEPYYITYIGGTGNDVALLPDLPPEITCPINTTIECDESILPINTGTPTATDDATPSGSITFTFSDSSTQTATGCGQYTYTITRTWTAIDGAGNMSSTCDQIIEVEDDTQPTITVNPSNMTVECDGAGNLAELQAWLDSNGGGGTAVDNCSAVTWTHNMPAPSDLCGATGVRTVRFRATDDCGNFRQRFRNFIIVDTTLPEIICPPDIPQSAELQCSDSHLPPNTGFPTATDNCSQPTAITFDYTDNIIPGGCLDEWTIERTWTATDECGNDSLTCLQIIEVVDTTIPVITIPPGIVEYGYPEDPSGTAGFATATDNCDPGPVVTWVSDAPKVYNALDPAAPVCTTFPYPGQVGPYPGQAGPYPNQVVYLIVRTWHAVDRCGNETTYEQNVWVVDTRFPRFSGLTPTEVWLECNDGLYNPSPVTTPVSEGAARIPATLDNPAPLHAVLSYEDVREAGDCLGEFTLTRTWTATDQGCNESTFVQTLHVTDTRAPLLTVPPSVTLASGSITTPDTAGTGEATAVDGCRDSNPVTITHSDEIYVRPNSGYEQEIHRTWTATDDCGNAISRVQVINILDIPPLMITIAPSIVVNDAVEFRFDTVAGFSYVLQGCVDPGQGQWLSVSDPVSGDGAEATIPLDTEGVTVCMFRVIATRNE